MGRIFIYCGICKCYMYATLNAGGTDDLQAWGVCINCFSEVLADFNERALKQMKVKGPVQ